MNAPLHFDPDSRQLTGPAGNLPITPSDRHAHDFLMLIEGQCLKANVTAVAKKYGYCRQRYYQMLKIFKKGGLSALLPRKTGPKSNYRRTDQAVRQVLRYRFLDPQSSPEVIVQKLRQTNFAISLRSVQRVIADYGLQKKTLPVQSRKIAPLPAHSARRKRSPHRVRRLPKPRTRDPANPGR